MIERRGGGLSCVVVNGQRSDRRAKAISNIVARKAVSLLAEGVRDGAAARAAHDYLYTQRAGKVSATLNIVSVDLQSRTLVVSRNSHCPTIVIAQGQLHLLDEPAPPVGVHRGAKPVITEFPLAPDTTVVIYTDGLSTAGEQTGRPLDIPGLVEDGLKAVKVTRPVQGVAQALAQTLLARALDADQHRPLDDISILVLAITEYEQSDDSRWLTVNMPL